MSRRLINDVIQEHVIFHSDCRVLGYKSIKFIYSLDSVKTIPKGIVHSSSLERILLTILLNSKKHGASEISVTTYDERQRTIIQIHDNGSGINIVELRKRYDMKQFDDSVIHDPSLPDLELPFILRLTTDDMMERGIGLDEARGNAKENYNGTVYVLGTCHNNKVYGEYGLNHNGTIVVCEIK